MDGAAAPALTLVVEKGPRSGETVGCLAGGRVRIGRVARGNTFPIRDAGVSQKHLSIEASADGAGWAVTDLGSSNGTLLNGAPLEPSAPADLRDGDTLKIGGETAIRVRIYAPPQPPAGAAPRRNPRRRCAAGASSTPRGEGGRGARGRGRPRKATDAERIPADAHLESGVLGAGDADGGDDAGGEEKPSNLIAKESSGGPRKKAAASRRGRGGRKKAAAAAAAAAPGALDSVSEGFESVDVEVLGSSECSVPKEVKQEIPDPVPIHGVEGLEAGVGKGEGSATRVSATVGVSEGEQVRAEQGKDAPVDMAGAVPTVEEEGRVDMENMTLGEWFDRMEKYIPKVINEIAEEIIADIKAQAERFNEHLRNSMSYQQQDFGNGFIGRM